MPNVLVIAPHALDEVLGCGGTIAQYAKGGSEVHTLVLCGDGTGLDAKRRTAAAEAAKILGSAAPRFAGFPENRSDTIPLTQIVSTIEKSVTELQPVTVFVPHGGNLNVDHQNTFRAAVTALRPVPNSPATNIYAYEIASSTDWAPPGFGESFQPNHFVEITKYLPQKIRALEAYAFDMRNQPHARSIAALEYLAHTRGASVGMTAAEAFVALRQLRRDS